MRNLSLFFYLSRYRHGCSGCYIWPIVCLRVKGDRAMSIIPPILRAHSGGFSICCFLFLGAWSAHSRILVLRTIVCYYGASPRDDLPSGSPGCDDWWSLSNRSEERRVGRERGEPG